MPQFEPRLVVMTRPVAVHAADAGGAVATPTASWTTLTTLNRRTAAMAKRVHRTDTLTPSPPIGDGRLPRGSIGTPRWVVLNGP